MRTLKLQGLCHQDFAHFCHNCTNNTIVTLFYAQNVPFIAKRIYQVNFGMETKPLLVLSDFTKN